MYRAITGAKCDAVKSLLSLFPKEQLSAIENDLKIPVRNYAFNLSVEKIKRTFSQGDREILQLNQVKYREISDFIKEIENQLKNSCKKSSKQNSSSKKMEIDAPLSQANHTSADASSSSASITALNVVTDSTLLYSSSSKLNSNQNHPMDLSSMSNDNDNDGDQKMKMDEPVDVQKMQLTGSSSGNSNQFSLAGFGLNPQQFNALQNFDLTQYAMQLQNTMFNQYRNGLAGHLQQVDTNNHSSQSYNLVGK